MHDEPRDEPRDLVDRVSDLLEQVLATHRATRPEVLDALCAEYPECAAALRRGYLNVRELDLAEVGQMSGDGTETQLGLPREFGPFRLLEFLGGGGMGAVYRAEDSELKREVALKLIRPEWLHSQRTRARFQRESEALARTDHPGLCTVYRAGDTDGQPWIAMRLVRGPTLAETIGARRASTRVSSAAPRGSSSGGTTSREELNATLRMFEAIARALQTAHAAGVVHRDIKPANIVLAGGGDPVVIDFGLVHLDDSESQLTVSGDHVGTPAYMAPEQVASHGREPDPRTDVYALAVTLFEALTLESPYVAHSREELFHRIVRGERRHARKLRRGVPAELDVVLDKALDPDPERRYASIAEFAEDLRRVREYEPTLARRPGFSLRARRWCQRNPVAATFLTLLSVGLGTTLALYVDREAAQRHSLAMAWGNLAGQLVDEHPEHALWAALQGIDTEQNPETLGLLLRALESVQPHETWDLPRTDDEDLRPKAVALSPNGDAALILREFFGRSQPAAPVLWRAGAEPIVLPIENGTYYADWSSDGALFVTTWHLQPPQIWSAAGELVATVEVPGAAADLEIANARFLPGGDDLVLGCNDGIARIRRGTGDFVELEPRLFVTGSTMPGVAVSPSGDRIALGDRHGQIVVHEAADALLGRPGRVLTSTGVPAFQLELGWGGELVQVYNPSGYECAVWSWEGRRLAGWGDRREPAFLASLDPTRPRVLQLHQAQSPLLWQREGDQLALVRTLAGHRGVVRHGGFRRDGERLLTVSVDGTARAWDTRNGREQLTLRGIRDEVLAAGFLGTGEECLMIDRSAVHRFDLRGVAVPRLTTGSFADFFVAFTDSDRPGAIVTADPSSRIAIHDREGRLVREFSEEIFRRSDLELAPDGRWLVSASRNQNGSTVAVLYDRGFEEVGSFPLRMNQPHAVFGPGDQLLLVDVSGPGGGRCTHFARSADGAWTRSDPAVRDRFTAVCSGARTFAYHAPTRTLAVAKPGAAITLYEWRVDEPELVFKEQVLPGEDPAGQVAFAPKGDRLLLARDREIRLCGLDGRVSTSVTDGIGKLVGIAISPRGDRFLTAHTESGVMIWDLEGRMVLPIRPRIGGVSVAAFLPGGDRVLIGTTAQATVILPADPDRVIELARSIEVPPVPELQQAAYRARVGDQ